MLVATSAFTNSPARASCPGICPGYEKAPQAFEIAQNGNENGGRCERPRLQRSQVLQGIDRMAVLAQFEMQMRDIVADARFGDDLSAPDPVAFLDVDLAVVGIGRDKAVPMADKN